MRGKIDRVFLALTVLLVAIGYLILMSAALGMLVQDGVSLRALAGGQLIAILLGIICGGISFLLPLSWWKKAALPFFILSCLGVLLVWIPGIGFEYNGAHRWIVVFGFSFQPAELLKIGAVLFFAAWLSTHHKYISWYTAGLMPFLSLIGLISALLLVQPDTGTFLVIASALTAMFIASGARLRDIAIVGGIGVIGLSVLVFLRPYLMQRLLTFFNPTDDVLGAGYQVNQSLLAIGSGEWFGRGYGQSIQKFTFLPEPIADSIFSVAAEEFGFVGAVLLIALFVAFAWRGFSIVERSPDLFSGLVTLGLVILIVSQSFINIASMIGVMPLTGLPLIFISNGGSAMIVALISVGIILNVSRGVHHHVRRHKDVSLVTATGV